MNIGEILNKITKAILNFDYKSLFTGSKIFVILFAAIAAAIILFGFIFSLIPQF